MEKDNEIFELSMRFPKETVYVQNISFVFAVPWFKIAFMFSKNNDE